MKKNLYKILLGCLAVLGSIAVYLFWRMNYEIDHLKFDMLTEEG